MSDKTPVITIDGPSGVGKGTICKMLASKLNWHMLDSGVLYRVTAWAALRDEIRLDDEPAIAKMIATLQIVMRFEQHADHLQIYCDGEEISNTIRHADYSSYASQIGAMPLVRKALLQRQRDMRQEPGLVTDGRDMGTVVFPDATVKFFFSADVDERAQRRYKQLKEKGIDVSLRDIQAKLKERDLRDSERQVAPLKPADDAVIIDTTSLSIEQVFERVMSEVQQQIFGASSCAT